MSLIEQMVKSLLKEIGESPDREGLEKTPERFRRAMEYLTQGYAEDPHRILNGALFEESYNEMLIVKDIDFYSLCEHHLLPFFGKAHVAYVPDGRIVGLSKLARLVEVYSRRLQVQERLTQQIATEIQKVLKPRGVAVVIEAQHLCMMMRGVQKQNSYAISSAMLGEFESDLKTRSEFMQLIHHRRGDY
jgi:GTP cyclohydrolase I